MSAGQMMGMELCRAVDEGFKLIKEP
jgi:hypothetical protein